MVVSRILKYIIAIAAAVFFLSALVVTGCGNSANSAATSQQNVINFGKYEAGVYTNDFFNLKVKIPATWSVMNENDRMALMQKAGNIIAGNDKNMQSALNAQDFKNLVFLFASESPVGAPVDFNPNFSIGAENLAGSPGVKSGNDVLLDTKKLLGNSAVTAEFPTGIYQKEVGGLTFDVLDVTLTMGKKKIQEKLYATVRKRYALMFTLSYERPQDLQKLESILSDTSFS